MTYSHLRADCLYNGIRSGPNARQRVWEAFIFTLVPFNVIMNLRPFQKLAQRAVLFWYNSVERLLFFFKVNDVLWPQGRLKVTGSFIFWHNYRTIVQIPSEIFILFI